MRHMVNFLSIVELQYVDQSLFFFFLVRIQFVMAQQFTEPQFNLKLRVFQCAQPTCHFFQKHIVVTDMLVITFSN